MTRPRKKKKKATGYATQLKHRGWNAASLQARNDKQVLLRLEHLIERSPRPKPNESDAKWKLRAAKYLKEFRSFFQQHGSRLKRLGVNFEDFGLLDPANIVPLPIEETDPRYAQAEEDAALRELAQDRLVRFTKLG